MRMVKRELAAAFAVLVGSHTYAQTLPSIHLPYQTYRATSYNVCQVPNPSPGPYRV